MPRVVKLPLEVSKDSLARLLKDLKKTGLRVINVAAENHLLYVYLEKGETRDPEPPVRTALKLPEVIVKEEDTPKTSIPPSSSSPQKGVSSKRSGLGRLALVGWGGDSGVGRELIDAARHLPVSALFIMPNPAKPTRQDLLKCKDTHLATKSLDQEMFRFLEKHKPDTILTWEVPGAWEFPAMWEKRGIHWVHVVHWDWFASSRISAWKTATLVAPNEFCKQQLKKRCNLAATVIPVPIDTSQFRFKKRKKGIRFASLYGYGGKANRRSLPEILGAWRQMETPPSLTIQAQRFPQEPVARSLPKGVTIRTENLRSPEDVWENVDVAVQVSRYEGVGVSFLEAQACGVPVIATDAPPMNEIAPDLLVKISHKEAVETMGRAFSAYVPSTKHLISRVQELANSDIRDLSRKARLRVVEEYSWNALNKRWLSVLKGESI